MDTKKDSAAGVPTFKVARVGEDRKRKGAGFSFLRGGGTRGVWSGATGGSGAAGTGFGLGGAGGVGGFGGVGAALRGLASALGMNFSKAMLVILATSGIGSAAIYFGGHIGADSADSGGKKRSIFSDKIEGDTSNLPSNSNTIPNSLGYLNGSLDGLTAEERAKKASDAAAAAAAAEAQRAADEEASRKAEAAASSGASDAAAQMAAAQAAGAQGGGNWKPAGSAFGKSIGGLSSSMGSGQSLTGGSGLSGGVNRNFAGAGGLGKGGGTGALSRNKATSRPTYSKAGSARQAKSNVKGVARKQLANANGLSRQAATASKGETAATNAGSAFDNNKDPGNAISGPGIGSGANPTGGADTSPNPPTGSGPSAPGPTSGGPLDCTTSGTCATECPAGEALDGATGTCAPIVVPEGTNVTPYQKLFDVAVGLLAVVAVLSVLALAMEKTFIGAAMGRYLRIAMMVLGGIIAGIGATIALSSGDKIAGGILALSGGFILATSMTAQKPTDKKMLMRLVLGPLIASALGGFAAAMTHQPPAAAQ